MSPPRDWSWIAPNGAELRIMQLPQRRNLYMILIDSDGMRSVARTIGDREATALVAWLDSALGGGGSSGSPR